MARRLVGSNQHRTRWGPDLPAPDRDLELPEGPPERRRCGEVWSSNCSAWVSPPDYSHGEHSSPEARWARARDPDCPPRVLAALAKDPDWWVRLAVAGNPKCPPAVLGRLARDPRESVRRATRANPACPPQWRALGQW
jgi:hypothetical protein